MRLIDIDKLFPNRVLVVDNNNPMDALNVLIDAMWSAPEVDAVEVTRCVDCCQFTQTKKHWGYCALYNTEMALNDFCSCGEREEDGQCGID